MTNSADVEVTPATRGYRASELWLLWIGASLIPFLLVSEIVWLFGKGAIRTEVLRLWPVALLIAYLQAMLLERQIGSGRGWPAFTLVGMYLASPIAFFVLWRIVFREPPIAPRVALFAIGGAVAGFVIGIAQFLWLRRRISGAGWWIPASVAAWTLTGLGDEWHPSFPVWIQEPGLATALFAYAALTGLVLVRALRRPVIDGSWAEGAHTYPSIGDAMWLCILLIISAGIGQSLKIPQLLTAVAVTFSIAAWATVKTRAPLDEVLALRRSHASVLLSVCLIVAGFELVIFAIQYPAFSHGSLSVHFWTVVCLCLLVPVAEEILFRGVILHGFVVNYGTCRAIIASAFFFACMHSWPLKFVYALALGLLFGWIVIRTGSLIPAMIGHIMGNALAYCAANLASHGSTRFYMFVRSPWAYLSALLLIALGFLLLRGVSHARMAPPSDVAGMDDAAGLTSR